MRISKSTSPAIPAFDRALAALNGVANAEETLIPRLLGWRGKAYLNSGQPEKALADLTTYARYARTHHANDPAKLSKGLGLLKTAHYRLKQYPRALEILAEEEKAYRARGLKFREKLLSLATDKADLLSVSGEKNKATEAFARARAGRRVV